MHKDQCASLSVSEDSRYLLTAGHNTVKVWDYNMKLDVKSQVRVLVCIKKMCNLIFVFKGKFDSYVKRNVYFICS